MEKYYGDSDPQAHLDIFEGYIELDGSFDTLMCRAFKLTLRGSTSCWYHSLPLGSITGWDDLSFQILNQFMDSKKLSRTSRTLAWIKKHYGESLRDFLSY